jgi:hypothetical protein
VAWLTVIDVVAQLRDRCEVLARLGDDAEWMAGNERMGKEYRRLVEKLEKAARKDGVDIG